MIDYSEAQAPGPEEKAGVQDKQLLQVINNTPDIPILEKKIDLVVEALKAQNDALGSLTLAIKSMLAYMKEKKD